MYIGSLTDAGPTAITYGQDRSGSAIKKASQASVAQASASTASTSYDFSNMSRKQMVSGKDALVSSGRMSISQGLTMDGMIGFPVDGKSFGTSPDPAESITSVDWFKKLLDAVQTTIKNGGPTAANTVAQLEGIQNLFNSLQGKTATVNTVA
ncbi:MAG: hypothetical protein ACRYFY_17330 [Janthinobacterium lividum]